MDETFSKLVLANAKYKGCEQTSWGEKLHKRKDYICQMMRGKPHRLTVKKGRKLNLHGIYI